MFFLLLLLLFFFLEMNWPLHLLAAGLLLCFHSQANAGKFTFDHSRILIDFCCYKNYDVTNT